VAVQRRQESSSQRENRLALAGLILRLSVNVLLNESCRTEKLVIEAYSEAS
jgi:hypothetical protein